jgi:hypothetical protein
MTRLSCRCLAQGRTLTSLVDSDGVLDEFQADERQRENLATLERIAAELRREERARWAAAGLEGRI